MIDVVSTRKHRLAICEECPLVANACAPTTGAKDAKIAVVSRSPGFHEAQAGKPFSGPAGKILDHLLKENGIDRSSVLTTNVVLCHTDKPPKEAIAACKPRLESEIARANTLILCGSEAAQAVVGTTVNAGRGKRFALADDRVAVVTNNPAAALRDDVVYPNLVSDFKRAINPVTPRPYPIVRWTEDEREALTWIRQLTTAESFAVDIESTGLEHDAGLVSIGIGRGSKAVVFGRYALDSSDVKKAIGRLLSDTHKRYVYHNGKFDVKILRYHGIDARVDEDSMLLSYILDERPGSHDLDYLTADRLGWPDYTPKCVKEGKRKQHWIGREDELRAAYGLTWDEYAILLYQYNGYDTSGTYMLYEMFLPEANEQANILDPYYKLLTPGSNALADIEHYGIAFDTELAQWSLDNEVLPELEHLKAEAAKLVGREINLNSPQQVSGYLYDELHLQHSLFRPGKERSVDAAIRNEILEGRAEFGAIPYFPGSPAVKEHTSLFDSVGQEFVSTLHRFKRLDKIRSTYIETLIKQCAKDGRIHANFKLHGTETGRLSGNKPNLQNQPRPKPGEALPNVRNFYTASDGHVLIQADYSQAELRVAAVLSGDKNLQDIYYNGLDLHTEVATEFYGADFNKEHRVRAKTTNFGILYGQEEFSLSQQLHITVEEARRLINAWWHRFPEVRVWVREQHKRILKDGYLTTATGRRRRFHLITDENKHHTLKEGVNCLIQSPASDLCLYSLIRLSEVPFLNILLTVHDSILFETKPAYREESVSLIKKTMEGAANELIGWDFPFEVDISTGERWGEL